MLCLFQATTQRDFVDASPHEIYAVWAEQPVTIDGALDDPIWQIATSYSLELSQDRSDKGATLHEDGSVKFAYDQDYLYAAFHFSDSDVVQESEKDQQHHYKTGDVAELFLKPANTSWYWELYATPNGKRTAFFFPGRGRLGLPSCFEYQSNLRVAAEVQGSLNDWRDRDEGWTAEMAIPLAELAAMGVPLTADQPWRVFIGRYNYSRYLSRVELSMSPPLPVTDYHAIEKYASLILDQHETDRSN
ncbi:MAG: carbohydrate-binding family 9-like protein [Phycisphaeraceae bacterium]|nr:carbohydrate-binding family 9-like protein [Phycisphaeraceae bacterium]